MLYIVCLHHCMYVCYMSIKYQSINQSIKSVTHGSATGNRRLPSQPENIAVV